MFGDFKTERLQKGKSIISFPADYTVIDLETTGLSTFYDDIIEVAALRIRNGEVVDRFQSLVRPVDGDIPGFIEKLTGITNAMVSSAPRRNRIIPKFINFIGDDIIVGHKVSFDVNFLYDNYMELLDTPVTNNFIDTMRIAKKLHPEFEHHRLRDLIDNFGIHAEGFHRAMEDCYSSYYCYLHMQKEILEKFDSFDNFIKSFKKKYSKKHGKSLDARTLSTAITEFDETHPIYKKMCVFTGKLEKMSRREAMQAVLDLGGEVGNGVTAKTNYLILGNNDYCSSIKDGKSNKQKKAEGLKTKGNDIEIITESVFYDMLDE